MNYKGLVDPKNKPFGNLLPFEVQVIDVNKMVTNPRKQRANELQN